MTFPFRNTVSPSQKCFCPHSSGSSCFPLTEPRLPSCLQERTGLLLEGEPRTSLRLRSRQPGSSLHAGFFFHNEGRASVMLPSRACSRNPSVRPGRCGHWMSLLFRGNPPKATGGDAMVAMERQNTDFRAHCGICCFEWLRAAPSHTKGPYGFWEREVWTLWVSVLCIVCYSYLSMVEGNSDEISRIPQQQL